MCHLSTIRIYVIKYIYAWKGKGGMDVMGWDGIDISIYIIHAFVRIICSDHWIIT